MRRIILWGLIAVMSTLGLGGCTGYTRTVVVAESDDGYRSARFYFRNGMRYYQRGNYSRARVQFELAVEQDRSYWEAHYYLAECYRELDYYDRSIDHYTVVINLHREPVWVARANYNIGVVYERQGRYRDAHSRYESALKASPSFRPAKQSRDRLLSKRIKDIKDRDDGDRDDDRRSKRKKDRDRD